MRCHMTFGYLIPLVLASVSLDANGITNDTIALLKSSWSKWAVTWPFGHVTSFTPVAASCDADGIINCTITFLRSRQSNWEAIWLFWSCDAFWPHHYMMPMVSSVAPLHSLGQDDLNEVQHDFLVMVQHLCQYLTLLECPPEHRCLPHHTCMSHYTINILNMWTPHYCIYKSNKPMNYNLSIMLWPYICQ